MTITTFLDPSKLPARTQDQKTFDLLMADLMRKLPIWGGEINETLANLNAIAAGGAFAFPYKFDSSTVEGDPGIGWLRLNSTQQNLATVLRIDTQVIGGADISAIFTDILWVSSAVKGAIRLVKASDPSKWIIFEVTSVVQNSGYRSLGVRARATGGGTPVPFTQGDLLMVHIDRNGDSGSLPGSTELLAEMNVTPGASAVAFPTIFDGVHDWYMVDIQNMQQGGRALFEFYSNGVANNTQSYIGSQVGSSSTALTTQLALNTQSSTNRMSGLLQLRGVNTNLAKTVLWDGSSWVAGTVFAEGVRGSFDSAQAVSGFGIRPQSGVVAAGLIRVYGVRKA